MDGGSKSLVFDSETKDILSRSYDCFSLLRKFHHHYPWAWELPASWGGPSRVDIYEDKAPGRRMQPLIQPHTRRVLEPPWPAA